MNLPKMCPHEVFEDDGDCIQCEPEIAIPPPPKRPQLPLCRHCFGQRIIPATGATCPECKGTGRGV